MNKAVKSTRKPLYDLEERCFIFAKNVRLLIKDLPKTIANIEDGKQVVRSSGSIGANYIEANEALSKKDFLHRVKISRKEAKETRYWLALLDVKADSIMDRKRRELYGEATELIKILSSIINKSEQGAEEDTSL